MNLNVAKSLILITSLLFSISCSAGGGLLLFGDDKAFISVAGGGSKFNTDSSPSVNTSFSTGALDDSAKAFKLGVGYHYNDNYFISLAAQKSSLKLADVNSVYASINYKVPMKSAHPYIGILAGYSKLEWESRPHAVLLNEKLTSSSPVYGIQAGIEKKINNNLSVYMEYQFLKHDHRLDIQNNTSNIDHSSSQNLFIGLKYLF